MAEREIIRVKRSGKPTTFTWRNGSSLKTPDLHVIAKMLVIIINVGNVKAKLWC